MSFLNQLGADLRVRALFRPSPGLELARVSAASHEQFRLYLDDAAEVDAIPAGRLRWESELPVTGDWVAVRRLDAGLALIEEVLLPRSSVFSRKQAGRETREQALAANLDVALVVSGLDRDFRLRRLERYFVLACQAGVRIVVALNKADLCTAPEARAEEVRTIAPPGTAIAVLSARESIDVLRPLVTGATVALFGSSGAGKSTIAGGLTGTAFATRPVRESDSRGRHTTTQRMLVPLPGGGAVIDTPGLRELALWAEAPALDAAFEDIAALADRCRYSDCTHASEPGCAVIAAVASGELDAARLASYRKLGAEIAHHEREADPLAAQAHRRKWKSIHKAMRHFEKGKLP